MTPNTRVHDKFEYHTEDLDCLDCLYYIRRKKSIKMVVKKKSAALMTFGTKP